MQLDCQGPNSRSGNSSAHTATLANPEPSCPSTNTLRSVALIHTQVSDFDGAVHVLSMRTIKVLHKAYSLFQ